MENETVVDGEAKVEAPVTTETPEVESKVELTDEERLSRLEGGAKRLRKKLGIEDTPKKEVKVEKKETKSSESALLEKVEKLALRSEGITHLDDIELAKSTAKKWGVDIDEVIGDEDFKAKLERQQTNRANTAATAGVKGGGGSSDAKNTAEYWNSKGVPPTREQVPDRKVRAKIARAMMASTKSGKKFYSD